MNVLLCIHNPTEYEAGVCIQTNIQRGAEYTPSHIGQLPYSRHSSV